jgi:hypothetical protein
MPLFVPRPVRLVALGLTIAAGLSIASSNACRADAKDILPPPITKWTRVGTPRTYNPSNLYDLVDGEAQSILPYSFVLCAHAEYAPAGQPKPALTIDVYDLTDPLDAFGMFGSDRLGGTPVPIGTEGVKLGNSALNFWKGRYVVRTSLVAVNPANQAAQLAFARATAARIQGASGFPPVLSELPPGYPKQSVTYERVNVAGQSYLKNGISARYPSLGQQAAFTIITLDSPAAAKAAFGRLQADATKPSSVAMGAKAETLKGVGDAGFAVKSRFQGEVVAAVKGRSIVYVRRARDAAAATAMVKSAIARVH